MKPVLCLLFLFCTLSMAAGCGGSDEASVDIPDEAFYQELESRPSRDEEMTKTLKAK